MCQKLIYWLFVCKTWMSRSIADKLWEKSRIVRKVQEGSGKCIDPGYCIGWMSVLAKAVVILTAICPFWWLPVLVHFVSVAPVSDWKNQRNVRKIVLSGGNYTSCIISCLENLEMSGKLTAVGELSEMFCQGNSPLLTSSLGLCQCLVSCCKHCIAILKNFFSSLSPFWTYCSDPHTGSTDKNVCFKWATQHG